MTEQQDQLQASSFKLQAKDQAASHKLQATGQRSSCKPQATAHNAQPEAWGLEPEASSAACSLQPAASCRGFTLIELLVVIAILTLLISLVTAGAQTARRRGAVTKAKSTVASIETAIAMYNGDMGAYPPSGNAELVKALTDSKDANWNGPYMEFKQDELASDELVDPWGKPYVYVSISGGSPKHRTRSYDLYSFGPDGVDDDGTQDDIINW